MLPFRRFEPGEQIRTVDKTYTTGDHMDTAGRKKKRLSVTVIRQYPHHVLVRNGYGTRWCITNAELFTMFSGGREAEKRAHKDNRTGGAGCDRGIMRGTGRRTGF